MSIGENPLKPVPMAFAVASFAEKIPASVSIWFPF